MNFDPMQTSESGGLLYLSLQRPPRLHKQMPHAPTNDERIREYLVARALYAERPKYNTHDWDAGERYARDEPSQL